MRPTPAGWRPRLVAIDIDGTLVHGGHGAGAIAIEESTEPVRRAVRRVAAAGVPVVLASGRSAHGMTPIWDMLGVLGGGRTGLGVASNGSVTFSYPPTTVLASETFDAAEVVRMLLHKVPDAVVAVEEVGVGYLVNKPFPDGELTGTMTVLPLDELLSEPAARVIIRDPHASEEDFLELAEGLGLHGINYYVGWTAWLDLAPLGVSKASALAGIAERYDIAAADVLAIGDGRNDVEMLAWAGRGVAMGQAPLEVQSAADFVTHTVQDDGVATELARWFP